MPPASKPVAKVGSVAFELERFALAAEDLCVVEGRWSGVRGRRFMRPALTITVEGRSTRLLADLADKPWAAEDGQMWRAAFPLSPERSEFRDPELTVAPDLTIALPAPARDPVSGAKKPGGKGAGRSAPGRRTRVRDGSATGTDRGGGRPQADDVRLQHQLKRLQAEQEGAAARMDELLGKLSQVAGERDEVRAARDRLRAELETLQLEKANAAAERDAGRRERAEIAADRDTARRALAEATQIAETARTARDRAVSDRAAAIAGQQRAESERDAAAAERDRAATERDGALALRDHALAERDAAVAARDEVNYQRDALSRTNERLQAELANHISTEGAALVMRRAAQERPASRRHLSVPAAVIATIVVIVIVVVVLIVLRGA